MKRIRLSRAEQREMTRRALLTAAEIVISRVGYGGTSVDLIAAEAGFSRGAVYSNFAGKEAIFDEVLQTYMSRVHAELEELFDCPPKQLIPRIQTWLNATYFRNDCPHLRTELQLHAHRNSEFSKRYDLLQDKQTFILERLIRAFVDSTPASAAIDHKLFAGVLTALSQGLLLQRHTRTLRQKNDETTMLELLFAQLTQIRRK